MATAGINRIPQYLKSVDPEVLEILSENEAGTNAWAKAAHEFGQKYGVPRTDGGEVHVLIRTAFGDYRVTGVSGAMPTAGKWRKLQNGWAPYAKNPITKEMGEIRFTPRRVPGLPTMVYGSESRDGLLLMTPTPFLYDGVAWLKLSAPGTANEEVGPQWTEVLGSEVMAAHEKKYPKEKD